MRLPLGHTQTLADLQSGSPPLEKAACSQRCSPQIQLDQTVETDHWCYGDSVMTVLTHLLVFWLHQLVNELHG